MGTIALRPLSLIHDSSVRRTSDAYYTHVAYSEYEYPKKHPREIILSEYESNGCCTSTKSVKTEGNYNKDFEWAFVKYKLDGLPSTYRTLETLQEWVDFINNAFKWSEIKIVNNGDNLLRDSEYWEEKNISFALPKSGYVIFAIRKTRGDASYKNLYLLSLIRAIAHPMYYFMVYDCIRLRKLKSLKDLSNWEIMNIAKYACQTNDVDFRNGSNESFLYYYRFPLKVDGNPRGYTTEEELEAHLNRGSNQNSSSEKDYVIVNVIYLMRLFQMKFYKRLHNVITNPKNIAKMSDVNINSKIMQLTNIYGTAARDFHSLNSKTYNFREYGKTV